jgi:hypothetical protein
MNAIQVEPGGGYKRSARLSKLRNSKRTMDERDRILLPTVEERQAAFQAHLQRMSLPQTYGDHMEVQAFAKAYSMDVQIFTADGIQFHASGEDDVVRPVVQIAYFRIAEHYCSVRPVGGSFDGILPTHSKIISDDSIDALDNIKVNEEFDETSSLGSSSSVESLSEVELERVSSGESPCYSGNSTDDGHTTPVSSPGNSPSPPPPSNRWKVTSNKERRRKKRVIRYLQQVELQKEPQNMTSFMSL